MEPHTYLHHHTSVIFLNRLAIVPPVRSLWADCLHTITNIQLLAMEIFVLAAMKNAAKCDN